MTFNLLSDYRVVLDAEKNLWEGAEILCVLHMTSPAYLGEGLGGVQHLSFHLEVKQKNIIL